MESVNIFFTDIRQALTPETFEVIIFCKVNKEYWDQQIAAEAHKNRRQRSSTLYYNAKADMLNGSKNNDRDGDE